MKRASFTITAVAIGHCVFAQTISPASVYAASGTGKSGGASIDWVLGSINMLSEMSPFPVKLINFSAQITEDGNASLDWKTAQETGSLGFEVQKSVDGKDFVKIGWLDATNKGDEIAIYKFEDLSFNSPSYYRLKLVDKDGKFSFSKIVVLLPEADVVSDAVVYPNPSTDGDIKVSVPKNTKAVILLNARGQMLERKSNPDSVVTFKLPVNGVYLVKVETESEEKTIKVLKE